MDRFLPQNEMQYALPPFLQRRVGITTLPRNLPALHFVLRAPTQQIE